MTLREQPDQTGMTAGTPCWIDLNTPQETAARDFYSTLLGWRFTSRTDAATGRYTVASAGDVPVAGLYQDDGPAAWSLHLAVRNVQQCAAIVAQLGGQVIADPVALAGRGSILRATDPGGAPVVFWELPESWQFGTLAPSAFGGADLNTHDADATDRFYLTLFEFTQDQIGDGVNFDYAEWRLGGQPVLYRYLMGPEYPPMTPAHWMIYFDIEPAIGVDALTATAIQLGGNVALPPYDSRYGRIAALTDPAGAGFSIIDHSRRSTVPRTANDDPYDD
ncbi:MAG: VOC family protein [Sciscionella sp.]